MRRQSLQFGGVSACLFCAALALPAAAAGNALITGRVVDANDVPVAQARLTISSTPGGAWRTESGPDGGFRITLPESGEYIVTVERAGYYELRQRSMRLDPAVPLILVINPVREVFQSVDVHEQPSPVDAAALQNQERLTGTEVNDIPYSSSHSLLNALRLMPGVVSDASGTPHFNGSSAGQIQYLLNGFDITDPIAGQFQTVLAVEGVRSVDLASGRLSSGFGRGSAGALSIDTESGTDTFRYTATDFVPGLNFQHGAAFGDWFPRFGVYGPIVRGHMWFADTVDLEYTRAIINGLPAGQDSSSGWVGGNLAHIQANFGRSNILFADFLVNLNNQYNAGLGVLDPVSTTTTQRTRRYFGSLRDQFSVGAGALLEFAYGHYQSSATETPQGNGLYFFSSTGRSGNYFINSDQTGTRDQGYAHVWLPHFQFAGSHQIEVGTDVERIRDQSRFSRTGYEVLGLNGDALSKTVFDGPGQYQVSDTGLAWWMLDRWRLNKRLQLEAGVRQEHDRVIGATPWSPRIALSWAPFSNERTVFSGGYAITHDALTLNLLGLPLDQTPVVTNYNPDGSVASTATASFFIPHSLALPSAANYTLNIDHHFTDHLSVSFKGLARHGADGFVFVNQLAPDAPPSLLPLPGAGAAGAYDLTNLRHDNYDSVQLAFRQAISGQFEWMVSYTWSRAVSNTVLDYNAAIPLQVLTSGTAPMPWDAPHHVLGWAYLPLPWKNWAVAALADARSGFPFSVADQYGVISGGVDSHNYPFDFDLNLSIERMITLRGYRFALRGGVNNLTNNRNPTAVGNTIGAPNYLEYYGNEGRHFVVRLRFFGRANTKP